MFGIVVSLLLGLSGEIENEEVRFAPLEKRRGRTDKKNILLLGNSCKNCCRFSLRKRVVTHTKLRFFFEKK